MIEAKHINNDRTESPPYGLRKAFETVKDAVLIEDYLGDQGVEIKRSRARCIVHGGDNSQSLSINPEKQVWHCFSCGEGGDLIDLCRAVEGGEPWEAMMTLAQRYNVDLPQRTEGWKPWQSEKARVRQAAKMHVAGVYQRRLTELYSPLVLLGGESREEEEQELQKLSSALWPISLDLAERRVSGE